jgi:hypothetical protein
VLDHHRHGVVGGDAHEGIGLGRRLRQVGAARGARALEVEGNTTGLATIVAEELDADWGQMRAVFAPADASLYITPFSIVISPAGTFHSALAAATSMARAAAPALRSGGRARRRLGADARGLRPGRCQPLQQPRLRPDPGHRRLDRGNRPSLPLLWRITPFSIVISPAGTFHSALAAATSMARAGQMRAVFAPADASLYNNLAFGPIQGTGGSTAVAARRPWRRRRRTGPPCRSCGASRPSRS